MAGAIFYAQFSQTQEPARTASAARYYEIDQRKYAEASTAEAAAGVDVAIVEGGQAARNEQQDGANG